MPWKPLPRIAVAVATYPFTASSPQDLPLEIGDDLYIIEQGGKDGSWYRGYLVAPPSLLAGLTSGKGQTLEARVFSGIFPRCCVDVREHLGEPGSEGDGHTPLTNGDSPKVNGNTPKRESSLLQRASSRRRNPDNSSSVKDRISNRDIDKDSSPSKSAVRSPSQHKVDLATSPGLARKLSHRSISNAQFRNSPDPSTPTVDALRDPTAKRPQAPVPMLKIGDETPTSTAEPLVDEIASCLREWHSKNLHELLLARRYTVLDKISRLVKRLDVARRQLLHGVLTAQELSSLREETVWDLVRGNKLLSKEIIVRDPSQNGRLLVGDDSPFEVSKLQSTMSLMDRPPLFTHDLLNLHHLFAEVKGFAAQGLPSPSLTLYLCARQHGCQPRRVTENFAIDLSPPDVFGASSGNVKLRTLFAELAANDIGDVSGPPSDIYLVIQVQASQQVQSTSWTPQSPGRMDENIKPRPLAGNPGSPSLKGGRQSLMWAQKQFGSVRSRSQAGLKPVQESPANTSETSDETSRPDTGDSIRPVTQQGSQYVKRSVGIGVVNLRATLKHSSVSEQSIPIWAAATASSEGMEKSDGAWDEILRDLISSKRNKYTKAPGTDHVRLSLQSFVHPEVDGLISDTPTLLSNITVTQKMDFTGAPLRPRSDIYVTLIEASLPHQALLSHPDRGVVPLAANAEMKNIQLTMEVRKRNGERIEDCIVPSSDSEALRAWRTSAVERGEPWNQTIKLQIPDEEVSGAHLIMSVAEAPGFPFALGWIPLMQEGTLIKDGNHAPLLYLYDKTTSSSEKGRGVYMDFPWSSRSQNNDEMDEALTGPIATVKLETKLCSTTFSQDKTLLAILDWRQSPSKAQTLAYVKRFSFVPEIEVVKMIGDVLDALFSILIGNAEVEENEDLVFDALVVALSIVYDRRFNLEPYLDKYAETRFDHAYAAPCLIRAFTRLVADHSKQRNSRRVRAAFKVGRHILKFIIRAREKLQVKEAGIGTTTQSSFKRDLKGIFNSFEELIRSPAPTLIGDRTLVVQHMPAWLPELKTVFSEEEILQLASNIVDACEDVQGKLILYKLLLILKLSDISLFSQDHVRSRIIANTARWIAPYWGFIEDVSQQWREQTRLCCSIVAKHAHQPGFDGVKYLDKVIESYCAVKVSNHSNGGTLFLLFPTAYPFPAKPTTAVSNYDECLIELSSILAHLSATPFDHIADLSVNETANMVSNVLDVVSSVLSGQAFPKSWLSLFVYHHKSMLQILESMFDIMAAKMVPSPDDAEQFNTDLWSKYLNTLLMLIRSDVLALETFPEQKRRVVWKIAGDVREQGSILLRRSWEAIGWDTSAEEQKRYGLTRLGGFQVQYVPSLVASTVELCLSVHEGLRRVAIKILQAMIISEWTLNDDLSMVQTNVIDSLDNIYKTKEIGNTLVQKMFINELVDAFEYLARMPLDPLWQTIQDTVSTIDELLDMLVAVHGQDLDESLRVTDTLQLMNFYKDLQKEHIFIRYVHQLADVQKQMNNHTEAGLALQLHADQYSWGSTPVRALDEPKYPEQSSFERKEHLYFEMITCFEEGAAWECALAAYRELANQYELVHFDFPKLARTQRAMATIYETVGKGEWQLPRYFRVIYRGLGFQENLQNREFIYQGEPSERLSAFTDRMRQLHPSAQILSKGEPEDMEGQYLQILPVSVYRDLQHPIYQQPKVAQSTRDYILSARPQRFAVTSKRHSPASMVQDQWIEKTVYATQEPLPTILRRSEIVSVNTIRLSPLQTAVERTSRKTAELATFERRVLNGDDTGFSNLTEGIISSVDHTSVATVAQYRGLVPRKAQQEDEEDEDSPGPELSPIENALQIALLDHVSMIKHCLTHYSSPTHSGTQSSLTDSLNHTFAPEMALLQTPPPALEASEPEFQDPLASPPPSSMGFASSSVEKPSFSLTNGHSVATSSVLPPIPDLVSPKTTVPPNGSKSRLSFGMLKAPSFGSPNSTKQQQQAPPNDSISAPSDHSSSRNNSNNTTTLSPIFHPTPVRKEVNGVGYNTSNGSFDRPVTSQSSKSSSTGNVAGTGKMKKRLSSLGLGRVGSRLDKVRGLNGSMGAVGEEE